ncbi:ABC1 family-domain-containing protein [Hygrophoropsis aurantiaca]|uniref:ABC1 family-domain-containing protein n=1 Tax=Hygrophoropsis aurantiaca TaxID=72124 RepID=A0ACB8A8K8_9AGAM|nr:ABC1 family-domain-containing protein [Hygrophoropsis aurantiaca]
MTLALPAVRFALRARPSCVVPAPRLTSYSRGFFSSPARLSKKISTSSTEAPPHSGSPRLRKYARRSAYLALGLGGAYLLDQELNASAIARNIRTLWTCAMITLDYKLNFTPEKSHLIPQLHERVADRMYHLFTSNGGLYIKIGESLPIYPALAKDVLFPPTSGQAIGANAPLMPRPMQDKFARLFDSAPQIPYSTIHSVFVREFGATPTEVFAEFDETAVASASIAQVHKARLHSGEWVAVKVQKPDVGKQMEWDLAAYRAVMWMFEKWVFDMPVYFAVDFINAHLRQELDFIQEAKNACTTAAYVAADPRLAPHVHIPKVFPEYSTTKVLTAEWIDGVRLSDRPGIRRLMGEEGSPNSSISSAIAVAPSSSEGTTSTFDGVRLKGGTREIMHTMVSLFSAQMFSWGFVHCDPHPGNILIRPNPNHSLRSHPQLVLLDHGLYVRLDDKFRREYAELWRGLLARDWDKVERATKAWGIGSPDLFASATLMRPVRFDNGKKNGNGTKEEPKELDQYEQSVRMKAKLKGFLLDTDKMPKALIFLGRNMRIVQGNNQAFGSPVNRIKITSYWASQSLARDPDLSFTQRMREYYHDITFRTIMFSFDLVFWASKARQWIRRALRLSRAGEGFEDELERSMRKFAKTTLGVDVAPGAFEG